MVDTIRERSAILALLPDNTSGEISPQDLRDMVVSVWGVYGGMAFYNNSSTQSFNTSQTTLARFDISLGGVGTTIDLPNDRITFDTGGVYLLNFQMTVAAMNPGTKYSFHAAINGTRVNGLSTAVCSQSASDIFSCSICGLITVTSTQILTILGESDAGGGQNITAQHGQLSVRRVY